jgi:hypothetical protein
MSHPGNRMNLTPGRFQDLVAVNREEDTAFSCHQTLPYNDYEVEGEAICRGYFDAYGGEVTALKLAQAMEIIEEVAPPSKRKRADRD